MIQNHDIETIFAYIFGRYGVESVSLFGSFARGEAGPDSDIDLLVEFVHMPSLVQFIRFENELKEAVGRDVDVVVCGSEKPFIKASIESDLVPIYGQRSAI